MSVRTDLLIYLGYISSCK